MATFNHILSATDFSAASRRALDVALSLERECAARLTIVHVCEVPAYLDIAGPLDALTPIVQVAKKKLEDMVRSIQQACPGARGVVKVGVPWEQILAVAADAGVDLIVMGTHGRRGVERAIMGSVSERVVRLSPVPVLTVRGP